MEKRGPSYTDGGNVNWYNHYGEQEGGSLKNKSHNLKGGIYFSVHGSAIYNSQDMEAINREID